MSALFAFLRSEPVVVWIGIIDAGLVALVSFGVIPGMSGDQKAAVDTVLQLVFAVVLRAQVTPAKAP